MNIYGHIYVYMYTQVERLILAEVGLVSELSHPHIIRMYGATQVLMGAVPPSHHQVVLNYPGIEGSCTILTSSGCAELPRYKGEL